MAFVTENRIITITPFYRKDRQRGRAAKHLGLGTQSLRTSHSHMQQRHFLAYLHWRTNISNLYLKAWHSGEMKYFRVNNASHRNFPPEINIKQPLNSWINLKSTNALQKLSKRYLRVFERYWLLYLWTCIIYLRNAHRYFFNWK